MFLLAARAGRQGDYLLTRFILTAQFNVKYLVYTSEQILNRTNKIVTDMLFLLINVGLLLVGNGVDYMKQFCLILILIQIYSAFSRLLHFVFIMTMLT